MPVMAPPAPVSSKLPPMTVFCAFTRPDYVQPWFDDLATTDLTPSLTNLVFVVDCYEPRIYAMIMDAMNRVKFRSFYIIRNYDHRVNEVNIPIRRRRIAEVHNQVKDYIRQTDGEYVLGLEDDTVFTGLSVKRLYDIVRQPGVGMATTFQAGRWHHKIIGVWGFDNIDDPKQCWTMLPGSGVEECDAAGFYGYLTRKSRFLTHGYNWQDWQPWGPDVNFGLWLRQLGFTNFVDWTQPMGHREGDIIITPDHNLYSEHFYLNDDMGWVGRRQDTTL